jgi:5,10-methylenetetrahydrofolate reductase
MAQGHRKPKDAAMPVPPSAFEFFPPKNLEGSFQLWDTVTTLAPLQPSFVSVTYGAGGTTRQLTHEAVTRSTRPAASPSPPI